VTRRTAWLALLLALALSTAPATAQEYELSAAEKQQLGPPLGAGLDGAELEVRAREVGSLLRCPVCQGLSIFDSPVPAAQSMQTKVELLVAAGYSEGQILAYFESSYGEFIRLSPKPEGFNLVVWILPVLALILGVVLVSRRVRAAPAPQTADNLEDYRRRIRDEVDR